MEHRGGQPASLWRTGHTWQYWSLIDWTWTTLPTPQVPAPPPARRLHPVTTTEARHLMRNRQQWVRHFAVYRRRELAGPDQPITVLRRRYSPEEARDEVYNVHHRGWVWTDLLVRSHTGRSSSLPALERISVEEAENILRHSCQAAGATDRWDQVTHDAAAPGWRGTGRDTGRHLPQHHQAHAWGEYRSAQRAQPRIDHTISRVAVLLRQPYQAAQPTAETLKTWPAYRRNVTSAWEAGEPITEAVIQTDLHRYTLTFPDVHYAAGVQAAIGHLEQIGFAAVPGTHFDLWDNPTYKAVTTVWRHRPTGRLVEILFHTAASFIAMLTGDPPAEVLRCRYLDNPPLKVTPAHRDYAMALLALAYDPDATRQLAQLTEATPPAPSPTSPGSTETTTR